jgi:putative colanic acid biosynthesis acetyltransferase WcaB
MGGLEKIKLDILQNIGNRKGMLVVLSYRISHYIYYHPNRIVRILGLPVRKLKSLFLKYLMGIEIPEQCHVGHGLVVWHGNGLIINPATKIGNFVMLRHTTTIGNKCKNSLSPVIGNFVDIGAHTVIIGNISIGDNVTIGAGSIVTKSIPANSIAYGNPLLIKPKLELP